MSRGEVPALEEALKKREEQVADSKCQAPREMVEHPALCHSYGRDGIYIRTFLVVSTPQKLVWVT